MTNKYERLSHQPARRHGRSSSRLIPDARSLPTTAIFKDDRYSVQPLNRKEAIILSQRWVHSSDFLMLPRTHVVVLAED